MATLSTLTGSETMSTHSDIHNTERTQINTNTTAIGLNTTHRTSDGSDHTFIDQDVTSGASPTFDNDNFTATTDKNYVTDAQLGVIENTSGTNTGDQDLSSYVTFSTNSITSSATPSPVGSSKRNEYYITALAAAAEFAAPSGTPANGNMLMIRVKDDGTARALTYNAIYDGFDDTLPATTTISKTLYMLFVYNSVSEKWEMLSTKEEG